MLTEGQLAPPITLLDQNDMSVDTNTMCGKNVVVYFYPKADTPGCTQQACVLRDVRNIWYKISPKDTPVKLLEALAAR